MERRRLFAIGLAVGSLLGIGLYARRGRGRASGSTSTSPTARWSRSTEERRRPSRLFRSGAGRPASRSPMKRTSSRQRIREHAYLEGEFVLRSGRRSQLLPGQVPLRDAPRPARRARRAHRRRRRRARAGRRPARRPGARRRRARCRRLARVGAAVPHRAQGERRSMARRTGSKAPTSRASECASSRTSSRPAGPPSKRSTPFVKRVWSAGSRSVWSIARRAERTRWRAAGPVLCRFFGQESGFGPRKPPQSRMVEPKRLGC